MTDIDVVVPYFDDPARLASILVALDRQVGPDGSDVELTVIVADDASNIAPDVVAIRHPVRVVRQPQPGYRAAAARNLGAGAGSAPVIVFLDGDTVPSRRYVERLTAPILEGRCGLTTGRRRHADLAGLGAEQVADFVTAPTPDRILGEPRWLDDGIAATDRLRDGSHRVYEYVISAVLAVRRAAFDAVAGFDESFDSYGGEDWELAYRCWNAGVDFEHVPDAVAFHDGPDVEGRPTDHVAKTIESLRIAELVPSSPTRRPGVSYGVPDVDVTVRIGSDDVRAWAVCVTSILASEPGDLVVRIVPTGDERASGAECVGTLLRLFGDQRVVGSGGPDSRSRCIVEVDGPLEFARGALDTLCRDVADGVVHRRRSVVGSVTIVATSQRLERRQGPTSAGSDVDGDAIGIGAVGGDGFATWARRNR